MAKNRLKALYNWMPEPLKRVSALVPFEWRMGQAYRNTIRFLKDSQYWHPAKVEKYQLENLKSVLEHAYKTVPYYNRQFTALNFEPRAVKSPAEICALPLLSRDDLDSNYDDLKSSSYNAVNSYEGITGGTTGTAVRVLFSLSSNFIEWGYLHTLWARAGFSPDQKRVALIGTPFQRSRRMAFCLNPYHNEMQLSALDLDEQSMSVYAKEIEKYSPSFLYGLPSAWMVLGAFLLKTNQIPKGIKAVLSASESITKDQREFLESVFGCPVYSWYGQTEKVALAGECEQSSDYHLFFEYGFTELIDDKGNVIREPGQTGEIVATGFINRAMPLIRYRTGDLAQYAEGQCQCGRPYRRLSRLIGRRESEYLVGRKGEKVPLSAINTQIPAFRNVRQAQFVQSEPGYVQLNILATPDVREHDVRAIRDELTVQLGERASIDVALVQDLIRTARGKVKPCVQKII